MDRAGILAAALAASLWAGSACAQATQGGSGSVTIVDPAALTPESELQLAPRAAGSAAAQDVAARYSVGGMSGDTFNLAMPSTLRLVRSGGAEEVLVTLTPTQGAVSVLAGPKGLPSRTKVGVRGAVGATGNTPAGVYLGEYTVILSLQ